ncbi:hypothetical protein [Jannaschia sp. CCS1]|uniref:hypothetical protein n=1 Tax=Jannaschia sp. (strain CCS1) TaxID=290400 RepID=UPI00006C002D|nr:hypothetical protein [Jannaschia sp. CCS1]ABD55079.1 hypothetical protein Jann_2162 [Jannaschia sp. CCS1]
MRGPGTVLAASLAAFPATATLDDSPQVSYRGLCQMAEVCTPDGTCGTTPALGDLLVVIEPDGTWMGQNEADLSSIDHYPTLDDALPLPRLDTSRRSFLTDLPPEDAARRFALRVQTPRPETREPVLRGQYFVIRCLAQ